MSDGDFEFGFAGAADFDGAVAFALCDVGGDGVADDFEAAVDGADAVVGVVGVG